MVFECESCRTVFTPHDLLDALAAARQEADALRKLAEEQAKYIHRLREALEDLADIQNGPPLPTWAKHWQAAMDEARAALAAVGGK